MTTESEEISDVDKVRIASGFIQHAPPGEFNEVFNDVRMLLNNDTLLREKCSHAFVQYSKDQFTPVRIDNSQKLALITPFNDIGGGKFFDPRSKQQFHYDHMRKEATDFAPYEGDSKSETIRASLQSAIDAYIENHYKHGAICVTGKTDPNGNTHLTVCIEAHQFQPKNYWNGRWRSQWTTILTGEKSTELKGVIKVQVHYYEDGNVQLMSTKEISRKFNKTTDGATVKEILKAIEEEEGAYQSAVQENYTTMSETTFKALRRQLPVTRTKIDWNKILNYKVAAELKPM